MPFDGVPINLCRMAGSERARHTKRVLPVLNRTLPKVRKRHVEPGLGQMLDSGPAAPAGHGFPDVDSR